MSDNGNPNNEFRSHNIADLTYIDIQVYLKEKDTILIPMASLEQHGQHLPLKTDTVTAEEVTRRVCNLIQVLHTPALWCGYSPQHMYAPGGGRGTITLRPETLLNLMYDVARSCIHHGFNRIIFINGHGSNVKVVDPILRRLRYETGALIGFVKPYMENYVGILEGLMENPPLETPVWHSSELETSQMLAHDLVQGTNFVRMERAQKYTAHIPEFLPKSFAKKDGMPDVEFDGYKYFTFPMDHHEFTETGVIGNPVRATAAKGEEALRRYAEHCALGITELMKVPVQVHNREFVNRV